MPFTVWGAPRGDRFRGRRKLWMQYLSQMLTITILFPAFEKVGESVVGCRPEYDADTAFFARAGVLRRTGALIGR